MDKALAEQWAFELESGKWKQGKGYLEKDDKFCCLGVLCRVLNISRREKIGTVLLRVMEYNVPNVTQLLSETNFVQEWTSQEFPTEINGLDEEECRRLAKMNDMGYSFKKIAKEIRDIYLTERKVDSRVKELVD